MVYVMKLIWPCCCYLQSEILEKSLVRQMSEDAVGTAVSDSSTSLYHSRTPPTSASAIEQLQSLLKQKEGELANAQVGKPHIQVIVTQPSHDADPGELPGEV